MAETWREDIHHRCYNCCFRDDVYVVTVAEGRMLLDEIDRLTRERDEALSMVGSTTEEARAFLARQEPTP